MKLLYEKESTELTKTDISAFQLQIREIGWDGVDWIDLAQDRGPWRALVNTVMNLRVP
jgi:hypothetical protein